MSGLAAAIGEEEEEDAAAAAAIGEEEEEEEERCWGQADCFDWLLGLSIFFLAFFSSQRTKKKQELYLHQVKPPDSTLPFLICIGRPRRWMQFT